MTTYLDTTFEPAADLYGRKGSHALGRGFTDSFASHDVGTYQSAVALLQKAQRDLDESQKVIASLSAQLARMENLATTDSLTGLKNRAGFEEAFAKELDRTARGLSQGGLLVIIDLDNFKAINDTYGHQAGDACLKLVAQSLAREIRTMDTAARLGGDEFILLMADAKPDKATGRVQTMAWRLNNLSLIWGDAEIAIQGSVGMKPYSQGDLPHEIFAGADHSMYAAKASRKKEGAAAL